MLHLLIVIMIIHFCFAEGFEVFRHEHNRNANMLEFIYLQIKIKINKTKSTIK